MPYLITRAPMRVHLRTSYLIWCLYFPHCQETLPWAGRKSQECRDRKRSRELSRSIRDYTGNKTEIRQTVWVFQIRVGLTIYKKERPSTREIMAMNIAPPLGASYGGLVPWASQQLPPYPRRQDVLRQTVGQVRSELGYTIIAS